MVMSSGDLESLRIRIARLEGLLNQHIDSTLQTPFLPASLRDAMHGTPLEAKTGDYLRCEGDGFSEWTELPASDSVTDTTNFGNNLSATDTTVQKALDTLDDLVVGTGDVVGPAGATDSNLCAFNTATGKKIKDSGIAVADVSDAVSLNHSQNTDTGTTASSFLIDSDSSTGKIEISVGSGGDYTSQWTNASLTSNQTITFPDLSGTVALLNGFSTTYSWLDGDGVTTRNIVIVDGQITSTFDTF